MHFAAAGVISGQYDVAVAGGVEVMTRVPMGSSIGKDVGFPFGPKVFERYEGKTFNQGLGAEMIAERWGFSREQLDQFSLESHEKAAAAIDSGAFAKQYAVVPGTGLETDEGVRRGGTLEALGGLKTAVQGGRRDHRRQLLADLRRLRRAAHHDEREGRRARPQAAGPAAQLRASSATTRSSC